MKCPVLLVHARGDEVVPIGHSLGLAAHLAGDATLVALAGGSHTSAQHDPAVHRLTAELATGSDGGGARLRHLTAARRPDHGRMHWTYLKNTSKARSSDSGSSWAPVVSSRQSFMWWLMRWVPTRSRADLTAAS